ncbi:hypothetical protein LDENG_00169010 [Lucifuga dentata]|nr:hypothetical protein LDENG_00169010 [Lucifuga dentata]
MLDCKSTTPFRSAKYLSIVNFLFSLQYILEYKPSFYCQIPQSKLGVGLYTRNSNLIPEKEISRGGNTTITTTHGKQFNDIS